MEKLIQPQKHSVFPTVHGSGREDFPWEVDLRKDKRGGGRPYEAAKGRELPEMHPQAGAFPDCYTCPSDGFGTVEQKHPRDNFIG